MMAKKHCVISTTSGPNNFALFLKMDFRREVDTPGIHNGPKTAFPQVGNFKLRLVWIAGKGDWPYLGKVFGARMCKV